MWFADFPWADAGTVAFAFVVGGMLGSFLNVVAHRVPAGESVVFGRSHCPHCRSPVRARDNVPILSWLLLRGRCRDCGGPIAPRYPLVEAACAMIVAMIVAADLATGAGSAGILEASDTRTGALVILHTWLVTTLLAWGLLAAAGRPVGMRTWLFSMLIAACGVAVASLPEASVWRVLSGWQECLIRGAFPGPAAARLAGAGLAWLVGRRLGCTGTEQALALAAFVCGWQAVPVLTIVTLLIQWGCQRDPGAEAPVGDLVDVVRSLSVPLAVVAAVACGTAACRLASADGSSRPSAAADARRFSTLPRHPLATGGMIGVVRVNGPLLFSDSPGNAS